jgi:hypothetical protein
LKEKRRDFTHAYALHTRMPCNARYFTLPLPQLVHGQFSLSHFRAADIPPSVVFGVTCCLLLRHGFPASDASQRVGGGVITTRLL